MLSTMKDHGRLPISDNLQQKFEHTYHTYDIIKNIITYGILSYVHIFGRKSLSLKYNIGTSLDLNYMCSCKI